MSTATAELIIAVVLVLCYLIIVITGHGQEDAASTVAQWVGLTLTVILGGVAVGRLQAKITAKRNGDDQGDNSNGPTQ